MPKISVYVSLMVKEKSGETIGSPTAVEFDTEQTLLSHIPDLSQKFRKLLKIDTDYFFKRIIYDKNGKPQIREKLNVHLSLFELGLADLKEKLTLLLYPISFLMEKETLQSIGRGLIEGNLSKSSKKQKKKQTGVKRRWCILKDGLLYYFEKKSPEVKPSGIIDVEYTTMIFDGNLAIKFDHSDTGTFSKKQVEYIFTADTIEEAKRWIKFLSKETLPGARTYIFGFPLIGLQKRPDTASLIPSIVIKTIDYIDRKALGLEGIFRVPGITPDIEHFKQICDSGQDLNLESCNEPHTVAGLLKLYLRELPEPLLTFDLYENFLEASKDLPKLVQLISNLPRINQAVLKFLLSFLKRVVDNKTNQMDVQALATVFAPNILRPREETEDSLMGENTIVTTIIMLLIENQDKLKFDVPDYVPNSNSSNQSAPPPLQVPPQLGTSPTPQQKPIAATRPAPSLSLPLAVPPPLNIPPPLETQKRNPSPSPGQRTQLTSQSIPPPLVLPQTPSSVKPNQLSQSQNQTQTPPPADLNSTGYLKAKFTYASRGHQNKQGEIDLSFQKGDVMKVLEARKNQWILVKLNEQVGLIPSNYVEPCDPPPELKSPPLSPSLVNLPPPISLSPSSLPPPLQVENVPSLNSLPPPLEISLDNLPPPLDLSSLPPPLDLSNLPPSE